MLAILVKRRLSIVMWIAIGPYIDTILVSKGQFMFAISFKSDKNACSHRIYVFARFVYNRDRTSLTMDHFPHASKLG